LILLAAMLVLGCGTPQQRYRVLSIFFDGVPNPDAPVKQSVRTASAGERRTTVHKPYADNQCNACHLNTADIFARAQVRADVCLDCHSTIPQQHKVMHGPVVVNECQMCHAPHSSASPHLLRRPAPAVCTQCHELNELKNLHKTPVDLNASCITCHSGHGGSDSRLLLAEMIAAPSTQPVSRSGVPR
jgi:predicted CXXCH cytochrome family protein